MADDQPMNEVPPPGANVQAVDATHGTTLAAQVASQHVISVHHEGVHAGGPVFPGLPAGANPVVAPYNPMGAHMAQTYAPRGIPQPLGLLPMNMWRCLGFENRKSLIAMRDHFQNVGRIHSEWFTQATTMWQEGVVKQSSPMNCTLKMQVYKPFPCICVCIYCYNSESTRAERPAGSVHARDGQPYLAQGSSMQSNRRKQTQCACETLSTKEKE